MAASYVAQNASAYVNTGNTITATTSRAISAGEHVICSIKSLVGAGVITSITVGSLSLQKDVSRVGTAIQAEMWSAPAASGIASGATVTVTFTNSGANKMSVWCGSATGVATSNWVRNSFTAQAANASSTESTLLGSVNAGDFMIGMDVINELRGLNNPPTFLGGGATGSQLIEFSNDSVMHWVAAASSTVAQEAHFNGNWAHNANTSEGINISVAYVNAATASAPVWKNTKFDSNKTASSTSLVLTQGGSTNALNPEVGDDLFIVLALDVALSSPTVTNSGTATFGTVTIERNAGSAGAIITAILRVPITGAGTLGNITITHPSQTARAGVAMLWKGVGTLQFGSGLTASGAASGPSTTAGQALTAPAFIIAGHCWEGVSTSSGGGPTLTGSKWDGAAEVDEAAIIGTTGSSAASNVTARMVYQNEQDTSFSNNTDGQHQWQTTCSGTAAGWGLVYNFGAPAALTINVSDSVATSEARTVNVSAPLPQTIAASDSVTVSENAQVNTLRIGIRETVNASDVTYSGNVNADGPLVYWRAGDTGSTAADASGNGKTGTIGAGITTNAAAVIADTDGSFGLAGTSNANNRVTSSAAVASVGSQRTFEAWINRPDHSTSDIVFGTNGGVINQDAYLNFNLANYALWFAGSGAGYTWSGATPADGVSTHVVLRHDDATQTAELFLNNVSQGVRTGAGKFDGTQGNFAVGALSGLTGKGRLDEIAAYPGLLSNDRIGVHYNSGNSTTQPVVNVAVSAPQISRSDSVATSESISVQVQAAPPINVPAQADSVTTSEARTVTVGAAPAGPNVSTSDAVTMSEARTVTVQAPVTPTIAVSDSTATSEAPVVVLANLIVNVADSLTAADQAPTVTVVGGAPLTIAVADSVATSEAPIVALGAPPAAPQVNVADAIATSEAQTVTVGAAPAAPNISTSDSVTTVEAPVVQIQTLAPLTIAVADSTTAAEQVTTPSVSINIATSDATATSEARTVALGAPPAAPQISISETAIGTSEAQTVQLGAPPAGYTVATSDTVTASEVTPVLNLPQPGLIVISITDGTTVSDTPNVVEGAPPANPVVAVTDTLTAVDAAPTVALGAPPAAPVVSVADNVVTSEARTIALGAPPAGLNTAVSDVTATSESQTVQLGAPPASLSVAVSESVTAADQAPTVFEPPVGLITISITEAVTASEAIAVNVSVLPALLINIAEPGITVSESRQVNVGLPPAALNVTTSDNVGTSEFLNAIKVFNIQATQPVTAADSPVVSRQAVPPLQISGIAELISTAELVKMGGFFIPNFDVNTSGYIEIADLGVIQIPDSGEILEPTTGSVS